MESKILRTETIKLDALQTPYYEIEFTHNNETKILNIGCTAWNGIEEDCKKYIKEHWKEL